MPTCIVVGGPGVGKSEFIKLACANSDQPRVAVNDVMYYQTVISHLHVDYVGRHTLENVKFALTEAHGIDDLERIRKLNPDRADFAIVMYDASDAQSWYTTEWINDISEYACRMVVVLNKRDKNRKALKAPNLPPMAWKPWIEVSCTTHRNVLTPFHMLLDLP